MQDPPGLLNELRRAMSTSDIDGLRAATIGLPSHPQAASLYDDFEHLYASFQSRVGSTFTSREKAIGKARGTALEAIVQSLAEHKYYRAGDICDNNVYVGLDGGDPRRDWSGDTIDVTAWSPERHLGVFFECKVNLKHLGADDVEPIDAAHMIFLRSQDPPSLVPKPPIKARAVIATLLPFTGGRELLSKSLSAGGIREHLVGHADVEFMPISEVIRWAGFQ